MLQSELKTKITNLIADECSNEIFEDKDLGVWLKNISDATLDLVIAVSDLTKMEEAGADVTRLVFTKYRKVITGIILEIML